MSKLRLLKNRRETITRVKKMVKGIEIVALQQFKQSVNKVLKARHYLDGITNIISNCYPLLTDHDETSIIFIEKPCITLSLFIFGADKGFLGALKTNLHEKIKNVLAKNKDKIINMYLIGNNTRIYIETLLCKYPNINFAYYADKQMFDSQFKTIVHSFMLNQIDTLKVIYPHTINMSSHIVKCEQLLPIKKSSLESKTFYINKKEVCKSFNQILLMFLEAKISFFHINKSASEHSSRYIAMNAAGKSAEETESQLKISYNKIRQSNITQELIEITNWESK